MTQKKGRIGSSFEDYLAGQGTLEETRAVAVKRVVAWQLAQAMEKKQITKSSMARAMHTSRSQLDRILDPENDHVRLDTLAQAAKVLDLNLRVELTPTPGPLTCHSTTSSGSPSRAAPRTGEISSSPTARPDDLVGEFVGQGEALAFDVGPAGQHHRIGDDPALSHGPARESADALGEVGLDHLDPLLLQEGAQAGHRIHAEVPRLAQTIGPLVDLGRGGDAIAAAVARSGRPRAECREPVDLDAGDEVRTRARLYRDRRDFVIQGGDTGRREDYPASPAG